MLFYKKNKNIYIILILLFWLIFSLFVVYKELTIFKNIENFDNPNSAISKNMQNSNESNVDIHKLTNTSYANDYLRQIGELKTINIDHVNTEATEAIKKQIQDIATEEFQISKQIKDLSKSLDKRRKKLGHEETTNLMNQMGESTSHHKVVTDAILKHGQVMNNDPPAHLVNSQTPRNRNKPKIVSNDPDVPDYATPWWEVKGNTPNFTKRNFIPASATNCDKVQCAPDGFALAQ